MARNSAIPPFVVAVAAVVFWAGRASAPTLQPTNPTPTAPCILSGSLPEGVRPDASVPQDAQAALLRVLELPAEERSLAAHGAANAWLAEKGAAALRTAREDPRLAEVNDLMIRVALVVHPDVFIEDPSLLEGAAETAGLFAADADTLAALSHELAPGAFLDLRFGGEMGHLGATHSLRTGSRSC